MNILSLDGQINPGCTFVPLNLSPSPILISYNAGVSVANKAVCPPYKIFSLQSIPSHSH